MEQKLGKKEEGKGTEKWKVRKEKWKVRKENKRMKRGKTGGNKESKKRVDYCTKTKELTGKMDSMIIIIILVIKLFTE